MVSADAPVLFTKACEIFILELTLRAWFHTEDSERRTLQRCDIARVVKLDGLLDFLVDLFCSDDFMVSFICFCIYSIMYWIKYLN